MSAALIWFLAFAATAVLWWITDYGHDDIIRALNEDAAALRHERDTAFEEADYWHQAFVALSRNSSNVRSIREAPKFDLIADQLAANEAARDLIRLDEVREMWKRDGGDPA